MELPPHLVPDYDQWGSSEEERKRKERNEWLDSHDMTWQYYFQWIPAHLAERRRLAGMPPRTPARRRGPLPEKVRRMLADLDLTHEGNDPGAGKGALTEPEVTK